MYMRNGGHSDKNQTKQMFTHSIYEGLGYIFRLIISIEISFQGFHDHLLIEHLTTPPSQVIHKVDEVTQTKEVATLIVFHKL